MSVAIGAVLLGAGAAVACHVLAYAVDLNGLRSRLDGRDATRARGPETFWRPPVRSAFGLEALAAALLLVMGGAFL